MMIQTVLKKFEPRMIYTIMIAALFLPALASYLYLFKKPLADYDRLRTNRALLERSVNSGATLADEIATAIRDEALLLEQLRGNKPLQSINEQVAHTIEQLDIISRKQNISLIKVRPEKVRTVSMFKEVPFSIEIRGEYHRLYRWLP